MPSTKLPQKIETEDELEEILSSPTKEAIKSISKIEGDIIVLGAGGKIGPSLTRLLKRAIDKAGKSTSIIAVSRFSTPHVKEQLINTGIEVITADLLKDDTINKLPNVQNVILMAGRKFGTEINSALTWATNTCLSGMVAQKYTNSNIIVFSTGNVYPILHVTSGGATESTTLDPKGEYAQSCLGRERIFEYFCNENGTKALFFRLNYANDLRYGVLLDIAQKVYRNRPIDLHMGFVNVIWQGDVNNIIARSFDLCKNPPYVLNVTGTEIISIQWLAKQFGHLFNKDPIFENTEMDKALLSNASKCHKLFGEPTVSLAKMIEWVAHWILIDGPTRNLPTNFDIRDGRY